MVIYYYIEKYAKFKYIEEINIINNIFKKKDITNYGINVKIQTLSIISNLLNKPNKKIFDPFGNTKQELEKYYISLINSIKSNIRLNNGIIYKYIHYNENLEISIKKYKFTIIAKKISDGDRIQILASSRKLDNTNLRYILFYSSKSDGGILRLLVKQEEKPTMLLKNGYAVGKSKENIDYITETFIHMDLQKFIYDNLHKISYCYYNNSKMLPLYKDFNSFYDVKDDKTNKDKIYNVNEAIKNFQEINENFVKFRNINLKENIDEYDDKDFIYFHIFQYVLNLF